MSHTFSATIPPRLALALLLGSFLLSHPIQAFAEDIKVEARLVWGTNEEESKKPNHKPVDAKTAKKLQKIFTWKNYFLEKRVVAVVPNRKAERIQLSPECTVEIRELAGPPVEVLLIGKGEVVSKANKSFTKGEWIVIGGEDQNECAWFVILKRL
jgi:hypothetical protein